MNDADLVHGVQATRHLLENFSNLGHGKRTPPREGLSKSFAFQKLHGDVGRAVIGLAGFVNGDEARVMNAARGSRFIDVEAALRRHMVRRLTDKLAATKWRGKLAATQLPWRGKLAA